MWVKRPCSSARTAPIVAHEIARPEQQVEEIDAAGGLLEGLVALDGAAQLRMEEGGEVGVGEGGEVVDRRGEQRVGGEDLLQRLLAAKGPCGAAPGLAEVAILGQLHEGGLDGIVVAALQALADHEVVAEPAQPPQLPVEPVALVRARLKARGQGVHALDQLGDAGLAIEIRPAPRRRQIAPASQQPAGCAQAVGRPFIGPPPRAPAQRAAHAFRRVVQDGFEPAVEGLAVEGLGLGLVQHLEPRIDPGLDRPLLEEVLAEAVDRADPRFLQAGDGLFQIPAARRARGGAPALLLQPGAQPQLQLAGRPLGEGHGDDGVHLPTALGEHVDKPDDQLGGLARARGGLDDQRLVERGPDALALGVIDEGVRVARCHREFPGQCRTRSPSTALREVTPGAWRAPEPPPRGACWPPGLRRGPRPPSDTRRASASREADRP